MKNKYLALAAFFAVVAFLGIAIAGVTGYGSIKLTDSPGLIQDSGGTTRISLATSGTNVSLTGTVATSTVTVSGSQGLRLGTAVNVSVSTPAATGILARDSSNNLYISTGSANPTQWVKVGAQ